MLKVIREFWTVFLNVGYIFFILLIGYILFNVPDQCKDFIYIVLQGEAFHDYTVFKLLVLLILWSFITWYSACIMLQTDPMDFDYHQQYIVNTVVWLPKILGLIPFVIIFIAFASTQHLEDNTTQYISLIVLVFLALLQLGIFTWLDKLLGRRDIFRSKATNNTIFPSRDKLHEHYRHQEHSFKKILTPPTLRQERKFILQYSGMKHYFITGTLLILLFYILMSINYISIHISWFLTPGAVLIAALIVFTFLFTLLYYFNDIKYRPINVFLVIYLIICSYPNDNTEPYYTNSPTKVTERKTVPEGFDKWVNDRYQSWIKHHPNNDSMPVYLIATQGGGIRGTYFTAEVLHYLDTIAATDRSFFNQVFAISGVSGGGVGATFYTSYFFDSIHNKSLAAKYERFNHFLKGDYLSPVTASYAFGDNLQRFLLLPFKFLERSKILGLSWKYKYKDSVGTSTLYSSFLSMWYDSTGSFNTTVPSLFINGTLAENGQKVITSNLKIDSPYFINDIDFHSTTKHEIDVTTSSLNCCRFPYLTSGASLVDESGCKKGHIVDGGYRENTGLQTLLNVYYTIKPYFYKKEYKLKPIIIYLKNGEDEYTAPKATTLLQDFKLPLITLYNVNGTSMPSKGIEEIMEETFKDSLGKEPGKYYRIWLADRYNKNIEFPLGWYMSNIVADSISARVRQINTKERDFYNKLVELHKK